VRAQIANEWNIDFETLIQTNDQIYDNYVDSQKQARKQAYNDDDDDDNKQDNNEKTYEFNRNSMAMLTNSMDIGWGSTPLRKSSFDLLVLLSTQESIHRILREYARAKDKSSLHWLRDFYIARVGKYFDGHQEVVGQADAFLEELLTTCPRIQKAKNGSSLLSSSSKAHLIDPMRMAQDIIRERSQVAREWKELVALTPHDHIDMRRILLARQMGKLMGGDRETRPADHIEGEAIHYLLEQQQRGFE
jgi:hypothetical protein